MTSPWGLYSGQVRISASLRRMRCGRWKVAGKAYRTKALARRGAAKRGLMLIEPMPWSSLLVLAVSWGVDPDGDDLRERVLAELQNSSHGVRTAVGP